jgi:hypothetical protein
MKPRAAALTVLVILALVLALTAPAPVPAQRPLDGTTVRVATWGGSWRDAIHPLVGTKLEAQGDKME